MGYIYVADRLRSVVLVFDPSFRFQTEFGYRGDRPSSLIVPDDLAIDGKGNVYVGQAANRGVSVFRVVHEAAVHEEVLEEAVVDEAIFQEAVVREPEAPEAASSAGAGRGAGVRPGSGSAGAGQAGQGSGSGGGSGSGSSRGGSPGS